MICLSFHNLIFLAYVDEALTYHLAALQKDGKRIQMEVLKRQAHTLKRLMPGMRRVVVLVGGCVIREEPLTSVVACYLDMGHPQSRYREILQFSIASLPQPLGLQSSSSTWKHDVYVSGGSRYVTENIANGLKKNEKHNYNSDYSGGLYCKHLCYLTILWSVWPLTLTVKDQYFTWRVSSKKKSTCTSQMKWKWQNLSSLLYQYFFQYLTLKDHCCQGQLQAALRFFIYIYEYHQDWTRLIDWSRCSCG